MVTIVRGAVPADEFALNHTLRSCPDIQFDIERIVTSGDEAVIPLLWVRGIGRESVERAFDADDSVVDAQLLAEFDDALLYRMEWIDQIQLLLHMLTNAEATVLDADGRGGRWQVRVLYPDRDHCSRTQQFCTDQGLTFDPRSIRELEGEPAGRYGLSEDQFAAVVLAAERGYFGVPRGETLEGLAEEMGISHQTLSERIRRGTGALVEDTLLFGSSTEAD